MLGIEGGHFLDYTLLYRFALGNWVNVLYILKYKIKSIKIGKNKP